MIPRNQVLARRYAQAFVQAFGDTIDIHLIERFREAADYLVAHKKITIFLALPCVDDTHKRAMLDRVCKHLNVNPASYKLIALLLKHKRSWLLASVLYAITEQLYKARGVEFFTIESFPALDHEQLQAVERELHAMTKRTILYRYRTNPTLIAGIRAQSASYLYERSIAAKLRAVRQALTA
jgi:ATP synthase F1 delta subunit